MNINVDKMQIYVDCNYRSSFSLLYNLQQTGILTQYAQKKTLQHILDSLKRSHFDGDELSRGDGTRAILTKIKFSSSSLLPSDEVGAACFLRCSVFRRYPIIRNKLFILFQLYFVVQNSMRFCCVSQV